MTDDGKFWVKRTPISTPEQSEVDRLLGLYAATQTPSRSASATPSDGPGRTSEVDRLIALAKRNDRSDSRKHRRG